ncbi:N-6 DNA methylase [Chitinophaga sp. S165]|uniref:N-6 DNA methylase n=1 Tax=Chitinophaga sp. S165 TaxID=2135462 RepID=UPI000D70ED87|nr:N-6 DNA methylase [Chitinophaga sp. S165]PWV53255.1 type I restriction enzyme M protein [Chitinophaga sp. S165]
MDHLGRYYTQSLFSDLLISQITYNNPDTVLELGVGRGSLLRAAKSKWVDANFVAADIDLRSVEKIKHEFPEVKIVQVNSLSSSISERLKLYVGNIDVAICNPPYLNITRTAYHDKIFSKAKLSKCRELRILTSDAVFLAQNLSFLKEGGQMGIIVPDTLITGQEFKILRESLVENHTIKSIIELPTNIFPKTEAKTHILFLEKGNGDLFQNVELYKADRFGKCIDLTLVSGEKLIDRMDFNFHSFHLNRRTVDTNSTTLESIGCEIKRGRLENKYLKAQAYPYIHTTSLEHGNPGLVIKGKIPQKILKSSLYAEPGDILLARVGKGCIGKVSMVRGGNALLSDCIYRIRVAPKYREMVFNCLASTEGQQSLKAISRGVCAKVLSLSDLMKFKVNF